MSRQYEMSVAIFGHDPARQSQIQAAATEEWPFGDWWPCDDDRSAGAGLSASAQHALYGGVSEEEFVERLSVAIWRANGGYCRVVVDATCLEVMPDQTHELGPADYARLLPGEGK